MFSELNYINFYEIMLIGIYIFDLLSIDIVKKKKMCELVLINFMN